MLDIFFMTFFIVVLIDWSMILNCLSFMFIITLFKICDSGMNLFKLIMILLSIWLLCMMFYSVHNNERSFLLALIFMLVLMSLEITFMSYKMIFFYIGFEMSVIPVLIIILGWGYQPDRIEAGMYMLLYTVFFSLPLLLGIFYMNYMTNIFMITVLMFIMSFMVKLPMFGVHMWLPRAHVEAPVYGSMILAGVMLKLGGYGIIKVSFFLGDFLYKYCKLLVVYSVVGGFLLSLICFMQSDMKMLVAYSSIVHMSLVLSGLLTLKSIGLSGAIFMMIGHGLCSSGLFCVLGFTYNRTHTRSIFFNKGLIFIMPLISLWWFLFCSSNLSFPPCLNLSGELFLFISILHWEPSMFFILMMLGTISSLYSIYLFSFTQHGKYLKSYSYMNLSMMESLGLMLHWFPLNILVFDLHLMMF
uniref:NADH-ubiquinone oxidoreductase chain 4 n=1 Tax=Paracarsidara gigantea TaxID=2218136 RepID=A0A344A2L6_9HEMI|nr:NADH dehydrogenase subunit 4 [Paracarsidara gigantea]AWU49007.1 NADH dehydrogenase subunit 4 [Paracarsidara gigantea]